MSKITIFGYGSLLSPASTLRTCPSMENHRVAAIRGYERIFSLVSISQIKAGNSNVEKNQVAALAVRPSKDETALCIGVLFDINEEDIQKIKLLSELCDKLNLTDDNTPPSMAAGCIFLYLKTKKIPFDKKNISNVCKISEVTINKCSKKIELLPEIQDFLK